MPVYMDTGGGGKGGGSRFRPPKYPYLGGMAKQVVQGGFKKPQGNPFSDLLNSYMNQMRADFGADSAADAASRDAALRRMFISYGDIPDFSRLGISDSAKGFLKGALNQQTIDLARKNTAEGLSVKARMDKANAEQNRRIPALLAGRGMLRTGQTGFDLGEQAQNYKIQGFDTLNELLGNTENVVASFLNAERERQRALAAAEMEAAGAAYGDWGGSDLSGDSMSPFIQALRPSGSSGTGGKSGGGRRRVNLRPAIRLGRRAGPVRRQRISGRQR